MSDLISLLPLLEGWQYQAQQGSYIIKDGARQPLFTPKFGKIGYLLYGYVYGNSPYLTADVRVDDWSGSFTILALYTLGFVTPKDQFFYIAKYDTINSVYAVEYAPSLPTPYHKEFKVELLSPTGAGDITASHFIHTIDIIDETVFRKSLARALASPTLSEKLKIFPEETKQEFPELEKLITQPKSPSIISR